MRLAVARLWFCSNSFAPRRTQLADLKAAEWTNSAHALHHPAPGSELEGLARFVAKRREWKPKLLRAASAPAGGPLSAEAFGLWLAEVEGGLRRERFDGVYLSLHGACQAEGDPAADLTILRRVRAAVGHTPVVATFDMHANLPTETTLLLDGASVNRVWPHGGGDAAALRALKLLDGIVAGRARPIGHLARIPARHPEPELSAAIALTDSGVLDTSFIWGFPWGDSPYAGAGAMVWTDRDAKLAREVAGQLAARMPDWRPRRAAVPPDIEAALGDARTRDGGRVALLDPADDPLAGGLADTPEMLRGLLRTAPEGPPGGTVFGALHDPDIVAAAWSIGEGGTISGPLAGRTTSEYGPPVEVTAQIRRLVRSRDGDGGAMAVLRSGPVDIVVCEHRPRMVDPALLGRAGIALSDVRVLAAKGGEGTRAALHGEFPTVISCDCPGPASRDFSRLPFKYSAVAHLPWNAGLASV
jgi:microcystin degradation protein MlrC